MAWIFVSTCLLNYEWQDISTANFSSYYGDLLIRATNLTPIMPVALDYRYKWLIDSVPEVIGNPQRLLVDKSTIFELQTPRYCQNAGLLQYRLEFKLAAISPSPCNLKTEFFWNV
jgi:hypothetical protein